MKEISRQNLIRIAMSKLGIVNFRNNTGVLKDTNGRPVRFGLCKGSSDIIGIRPVTITLDMVGQTIGQFVAVEVKTPKGKPTSSQIKFLDMVKKNGGAALIARTPHDIEEL